MSSETEAARRQLSGLKIRLEALKAREQFQQEDTKGVVGGIVDLFSDADPAVLDAYHGMIRAAEASLAEASRYLEQGNSKAAFDLLKSIDRTLVRSNSLWKNYEFATLAGAREADSAQGLAIGGGIGLGAGATVASGFGAPVGLALMVGAVGGAFGVSVADIEEERGATKPVPQHGTTRGSSTSVGDFRLTAIAKEALDSDQAYQKYGSFFLDSEGWDDAEELKTQWQEEFSNFNRIGVKKLMQTLYRKTGGLQSYVQGEARMGSLLNGKGGNCEAQTKLVIAAISDSGIKLPEGFILGVQVFSNHVQPVLFNPKTGELWDLMSNERTKKIVAPIYDPKIFLHAYLTKAGEPVPSANTLLIHGPKGVGGGKAASLPTNSNLGFPPSVAVFGDGGEPPARADLASPYEAKKKGESMASLHKAGQEKKWEAQERKRQALERRQKIAALGRELRKVEEIIRKNPKILENYAYHAEILIQLGRYQKAIHVISYYIEEGKESEGAQRIARAYSLRANAYAMLGRESAMRTDIQEALKMPNDYVKEKVGRAYYNLGVTYCNRFKSYNGAITLARRALQYFPDHKWAPYLIEYAQEKLARLPQLGLEF